MNDDQLRTSYTEAGGDPAVFDNITTWAMGYDDNDPDPTAANRLTDLMRDDVLAMSNGAARFTCMMASYMIAQGVDPEQAKHAASVVFQAFKFNASQLVVLSGQLRDNAKHIRDHHEGGKPEGRCDQDESQKSNAPAAQPDWWGKLFQ